MCEVVSTLRLDFYEDEEKDVGLGNRQLRDRYHEGERKRQKFESGFGLTPFPVFRLFGKRTDDKAIALVIFSQRFIDFVKNSCMKMISKASERNQFLSVQKN